MFISKQNSGESFPHIVESNSTNKKCLQNCRHEGHFHKSMKAIGYFLFQIKAAAPKTAALSLIPEGITLIFPL